MIPFRRPDCASHHGGGVIDAGRAGARGHAALIARSYSAAGARIRRPRWYSASSTGSRALSLARTPLPAALVRRERRPTRVGTRCRRDTIEQTLASVCQLLPIHEFGFSWLS
jgi:hypothetical protein